MIDDPPQESDAATRPTHHTGPGDPIGQTSAVGPDHSSDRGGGQSAQMERVAGRIGCLVLDFVRHHRRWTSAELHAAVDAVVPTAPGSETRILRQLRRRGLLDYRVTSRSRGEYERVDTPEAEL